MSVVRVSPSDFSSRTSARTALAPDNLETSRVLVAQQGWIPGCLLPKTSIDWLYNRIPTQSERELFQALDTGFFRQTAPFAQCFQARFLTHPGIRP